MNKYIIDNMIFDHLIFLDDSELNKLWQIWDFFVVSNVKNYQLQGLIDKNPWNAEKIEQIFSILKIITLPNKTFPWMEENPFGPGMYPFRNNDSPTFHAVRWATVSEGSLHDALIADATSIIGWTLITEDGRLTRKCQENSIQVLNWWDFLQSSVLKT